MTSTHAWRLPVLVLCALLAACGRGGNDVQMGDTEKGQPPEQPAQQADQAPPQYAILIGWDGTAPTVSQDTTIVVRKDGPIVAWADAPTLGNRSWLVAFGGPTPFQNGRRSFSSAGPGNGSRQGPINPATALGAQYKYWVWVTDDDGEWVPLDPRLRIVDDPGVPTDTASAARR